MAGRPTKCTPELIEQARDYVLTYSEVHEHIIPSIVGLCRVLGVAKSSIYLWAAAENNEFSDIVEEINEYQHHDLVNGGLKGDLNPTITKLLLAKHGHSDKVDTTLANAEGQSFKTDNKWSVEFVNATPESK